MKSQPCCRRCGSVTKSEVGIFETSDMANHLLVFTGSVFTLVFKKTTESGKVINGGSIERSLGGAEFQRGQISTPISEK